VIYERSSSARTHSLACVYTRTYHVPRTSRTHMYIYIYIYTHSERVHKRVERCSRYQKYAKINIARTSCFEPELCRARASQPPEVSRFPDPADVYVTPRTRSTVHCRRVTVRPRTTVSRSTPCPTSRVPLTRVSPFLYHRLSGSSIPIPIPAVHRSHAGTGSQQSTRGRGRTHAGPPPVRVNAAVAARAMSHGRQTTTTTTATKTATIDAIGSHATATATS
jgi:hypothetical protein